MPETDMAAGCLRISQHAKDAHQKSMRIRRCGDSVRPSGHWYHEPGEWLRSALKLRTQENGRARQIRTPSRTVCLWNVKHQMRNPVPTLVGKGPLSCHHVAHRARFLSRQVFFAKHLDTVNYLSFGQSSQFQLCPLDSDWKDGSCSRRIEADRTPQLGVPKFRCVERGHPGSLHDTHKTVLAFHCGHVAAPSKNQDLGIAGDSLRSGTTRHGNL